jgi:hypothetical protein
VADEADAPGSSSAAAAALARPSPPPGIAGRLVVCLVGGASAVGRSYGAARAALRACVYDFKLRHMQPLHRVRLPPWRRRAHTVVHHKWFVRAMTGFILVNTVALAMDHYGISREWARAIDIINNGAPGGPPRRAGRGTLGRDPQSSGP